MLNMTRMEVDQTVHSVSANGNVDGLMMSERKVVITSVDSGRRKGWAMYSYALASLDDRRE